MPIKNYSHIENHLHILIYLYTASNGDKKKKKGNLECMCKDFIESGNHLPVHYPNYLSYVNT